MFICKYCGKECKNKNSLVQHEIRCKSNPNRKEYRCNNNYSKLSHVAWNKGLTKDTDERVKQQSLTTKERYKNKIITPYNLGTHHSEETKKKISKARIDYLTKHPEKIPYILNHHSKKSFPERYFEMIFSKDDILNKFIPEYRIGLYSLDFAIPELKFYLEIDGEQHYLDKRIIKHDTKRTNDLKELGWISKRIRWSTYRSLSFDERKHEIKSLKTYIEDKIKNNTAIC